MTRLVRGWHTWQLLSPQERAQWLQAWLLLPFVVLGLQLFGLRRVRAMLHCITVKTLSREDLPASVSLAHIVHRAVRWNLLPASCLARSLVLCWLLRTQGLDAELRIGVAKIDGHFAAHAWVEHVGVALEKDDLHRHFVAYNQIVTSTQSQKL